MATNQVLFIQGGGEGAHAADAPLVESLRQALGAGHEVHFAQMPDEGDPNVAAWKRKIAAELRHLPGAVTLVAHSVGGSILLKYLSEEPVQARIAGLFLLAAPSWDGQRWAFDDLLLPSDLAEKLASIPRLFFYHCRDDEEVPFEHLALHGARLPRAITRAFARGGHQFGNNLKAVAADIRAGADALET